MRAKATRRRSEATVTACEIAYRPRRQLMVTVDDGSDTCVLRFFSF